MTDRPTVIQLLLLKVARGMLSSNSGSGTGYYARIEKRLVPFYTVDFARAILYLALIDRDLRATTTTGP